MEYKSIDDYIDKICEQIRFKKAHNQIAKEIENHIIEQKESFLKYGLNEKEALEKAINEMGDAILVGEKFNEVYKPKINWNIIFFVSIISIIFTIVQSVFSLYDNNAIIPSYLTDIHYIVVEIVNIIISILVMILVCYIDFTKILKYSFFMYVINIVLSIFTISSLRRFNVWIDINRMALIMFDYLPLFFTGIVYSNRNTGYKGIFNCLFYILLPLIFRNILDKYILIYYVISTVLILIYSINKGYFKIKNKYLVSSVIILTFILIYILSIYFFADPYYLMRIKMSFFNTDKLGSGYVNYVISEILKNSQFIGSMIPLNNTNIDINLINKLNDMIILKLIMKFGYLSAIIFVSIFLIFFTYIYNICKKQKSVLGNLACISIFMMLFTQFITTVQLNIFYIFPSIGLPFVSEGLIYKTYVMFNIGIFLSAYRQKSIFQDNLKIFNLKVKLELKN